MICAIDIGNSHIVTCLMESADSIIFTGRVRSDRDKTAEEYFVEMKTLSAAYGVSFDHLDGVMYVTKVEGELYDTDSEEEEETEEQGEETSAEETAAAQAGKEERSDENTK